MKNIEESIKQLKNIGPSEDYKSQSLRIILSTSQKAENKFGLNIWDVLKYSVAMGLTGVLIIFSLSDTFFSLNAKILSPILLSSLSEENIKNEASEVGIKISISEAKYYNDSVNKVAVALNETAKNGPGHLNQTIIEKEMQELDMTNENNKNIDDLLNKLTL